MKNGEEIKLDQTLSTERCENIATLYTNESIIISNVVNECRNPWSVILSANY